ncbi:hypothetical protein [Paeniglutamicibacter psychrophenolicus]|uniref:hypothetical protein n=1 Tax=Paeniglutamicibacter psychrophenolicus TaxID=257454 RepID=UPI002789671C|nr:hypothetical protein [Paeniglutamicibacter psychrophenolicus]MDQ0094620.1 hypothetical protein [Paeniglutamicibacter psychrophenolicus]
MSTVNPENSENPTDLTPGLDDVIEPETTALPHSSRRGHGKVPETLDDEDFAAAEYQERVAAGLEDYDPDEVPDATDPLPAGVPEEAERVELGLGKANDDDDEDEEEYPHG